MAEAMVQSAFTQPRAAVWVRVDATRTMDLVASLKQQPNLAGVRLSPLAIIALAVCDAARHFPGINSSFDAAANEVIVRRSVNLGIAANTPRGLIVPNIKGADQLDLVGMASALTVLVDRAREGTTTPNEMIGTTLSITNVGPSASTPPFRSCRRAPERFSPSVRLPKRRGWLTTRWSCAKWSSWPWPSITARSTGRWPQRYSRTSVGSCTTPPRQLSPAKPAVREVRRAICQRGCSCSTHC